MPETEKSHGSNLESPASTGRKNIGNYATGYAKVYQFFGFNRGYNFPLCEFRPPQTFDLQGEAYQVLLKG